MEKTGKNFKIFGIRGSLIGDSIMALPILNLLEKEFPGSYKYWQIARKCSQSAQLYLNHPLIDQIVISDCEEGMGPRDKEIASKCDIVFDLMPQHPTGDSWPNTRNIYEETWMMAKLPLHLYYALPIEQQRPKLTKWFDIVKQPQKTVALWPCAGYGKENKRNPSVLWYFGLVGLLTGLGYKVIQFGHPKDFDGGIQDLTKNAVDSLKTNYVCMNNSHFFDQIKTTLGCDLMIGTDSGSSLIVGAYDLIPQITLLTNHWPGHVQNFTAFASNAPKNHNLFAENGADNIKIMDVINRVKELI